jgi:hypothetical protein
MHAYCCIFFSLCVEDHHDASLPDVFFHWSDCWSISESDKRARDVPTDPYFVPGDLVSFSVHKQQQQQNGKESSYKTHARYHAKQVRLYKATSMMPTHKRLGQTRGVSSNAAPAAAAAAPAVVAAIHSTIPRDKLSALTGQRMCGVVSRLPEADLGYMMMYHTSNCVVSFTGSQAREAAVGASSLETGEVLEFTLDCANDKQIVAQDLRRVPTVAFETFRQNQMRQQQIEALSNQLEALTREIASLYIDGSCLVASEAVEFHSLGHGGSGMSRNLYDIADKQLNAFVNGKGGTLLFGVQEDDGRVVGLELDATTRDLIRQEISALMRSCTPQIDERTYTLRFVPVVSLYKSSWNVELDTQTHETLGSTMAKQHCSPDEMTHLMLQAEVGDRVAELRPRRFVIAISITAGPTSVPYTKTKRRQVWVRSLAGSMEMSVEEVRDRYRQQVVSLCVFFFICIGHHLCLCLRVCYVTGYLAHGSLPYTSVWCTQSDCAAE